MTNIINLRDYYSDFSFIDRDAPGGFARVWRVTRHNQDGPDCAAFKVMRPEVYERHSDKSDKPFANFLSEVETLIKLVSAKQQEKFNPLSLVTDIYDTGFIRKNDVLNLFDGPGMIRSSNIQITRTGLSSDAFNDYWENVGKKKEWLPYIVVELAEYDDSLYRRIHRYTRDIDGIYRLPTLEAIVLTIRLLDFISWFHKHNQAYIDWKPEHIYWNGATWNLKLIDYNVTVPLDGYPGKPQNMADDIRLLAGSALYSALTLSELDDQIIAPKSTRNFKDPVGEIRGRYKIDKPEDLVFPRVNKYLDKEIKDILGKALTGTFYKLPEDLKSELIKYLENKFNLSEKIVYAHIDDLEKEKNPYVEALLHIHRAKGTLDKAYQSILRALRNNDNLETERLSYALNQMRRDSPIP